jgi:amino acid transporter
MAIIAYFLPYLFLFGSMIRLQSRPAGPEVRRVPGGKPVAIVLGLVGMASTAMTILLSAIPADDEPNKLLVLVKVVGGTIVLVGAGLAVYLFSRWKTRRSASGELEG